MFSLYVGMQDSNTAEVMAIEKACHPLSSNPWVAGQRLEVASDSATAVSWVTGDGFGSITHVNQVYNIRSILRGLEGAQRLYNPRSTNTFADRLAKMGSNMAGDFIEWGDF